MLELPSIRATSQVMLAEIQARAAVEKTAVAVAAAASPAGAAAAPAALAAAEAKEKAEVAAFVSSFLQPALDIARPTVSNLGAEVVGHSGGGALATGAGAVQSLGDAATQVSGGVQAAGQTLAVQPVTQTVQQVGQVANATGPVGQGVSAGQVGQMVTSPAGGVPVGGAPGKASGAPMPGNTMTTPPEGSQHRATEPGRQRRRVRAVPVLSGSQVGPTRTGMGTVAQPLLPRGVAGAVPGAPGAGTPGSGPGGGAGPATGVPGGVGAGGTAPRGSGSVTGAAGHVTGVGPGMAGGRRRYWNRWQGSGLKPVCGNHRWCGREGEVEAGSGAGLLPPAVPRRAAPHGEDRHPLTRRSGETTPP